MFAYVVLVVFTRANNFQSIIVVKIMWNLKYDKHFLNCFLELIILSITKSQTGYGRSPQNYILTIGEPEFAYT